MHEPRRTDGRESPRRTRRGRTGVAVCILAAGRREYFRAARLAALSALRRTGFQVTVVHGDGPSLELPEHPRLRTRPLPSEPERTDRAGPFLLKFRALASCLEDDPPDHLILCDADALVASPIEAVDVLRALDGKPLGMVEQTTVRGSAMNRDSFLAHYVEHSLAWLDPEAEPPPRESFRYYNSGVVLGEVTELRRICAWAEEEMRRRAGSPHRVGRHMIADQDYFQFWTNTLHPGSCADLSWEWNHCEHWDEGFPRPGARILHFSNFCQGPDRNGLRRMRRLAGEESGALPRRWWRRLTGSGAGAP